MGILEIIALGIGLAMDAFAVAVCEGLTMKKISWKHTMKIAVCFSLFHAGMPIIGYFLGAAFSGFIESADHWIAFVLLTAIGGKMIWDSHKKKKGRRSKKADMKSILLLAIATSIDALAVGVTLAFFEVNIFLTALIIGVITFVLLIIGVKIGNEFGNKLKNRAELIGGIILILIGLKILLEHLEVIVF